MADDMEQIAGARIPNSRQDEAITTGKAVNGTPPPETSFILELSGLLVLETALRLALTEQHHPAAHSEKASAPPNL